MVALIEVSASTVPSTVTLSPSLIALHDPPLKLVELVVRTVRAFTTKVSAGHWPCNDEISPLTVVDDAGGVPAWLTATFTPPTTIVPVRDVEVFAAIVKPTVPLPVP